MVYGVAYPCQTLYIPHIIPPQQWDSIYIQVSLSLDHYATAEVHCLSYWFQKSVFGKDDLESCIEVGFEDPSKSELVVSFDIFLLSNHHVDYCCPSFINKAVHKRKAHRDTKPSWEVVLTCHHPPNGTVEAGWRGQYAFLHCLQGLLEFCY